MNIPKLSKMFRRIIEGTRPLVALARGNHDKKWTYRSLPLPDEGTDGEKMPDINLKPERTEDMFITAESFSKLFNGIPYDKLPICDIKVTKNNTILTLSTPDGTPQLLRSCGMEGFKNARKGTNIAAQATAIGLSGMALDKGIKTIRVRVGGLGPGRMAAIKGLQMGGMEIVSITDRTRVSWNPPRPRKVRRL